MSYNSKLLLYLKDRNTFNSQMYVGFLNVIIKDIKGFLEFIKKIFPDYPDHGIEHSLRIEDYINDILGESLKKLSDTEIFCFILATLFHDTGMALIGYTDKSSLRSEHHYKAATVIDKYFDQYLKHIPNIYRIKYVTTFVCEAHNLSIEDLYTDTRFNKEDTINGDNVRYSVLAVLLRIGDLMDLDENRVNKLALEMFPDIFSVESLNHNERHLNVRLYSYSSERIEIEVLSENVQQHKIWTTWFDYLKNDILRANTHLNGKEIFFPLPHTKIVTSDSANYTAEEIRFEIDDSGGIWNILSKSIYTNELDFLREIIQNAIDATLMKIYIDTNINLNYKSPRSWNSNIYCDNISVCYSEVNNQIFIVDTGIGMNSVDLKKFLFKVSSSGYTENNIRDFPFPGIAKYGIGFVSCLICADFINIYTKKYNEKNAYKVSLDTKSSLAFIEDYNYTDFTGTAISLKLKEPFTFIKIREYIKNTFMYPSVGIDIINMDLLLHTANNLGKKMEFEDINKEPNRILEVIKKINTQREIIVKPIQKNISELNEIIFNSEKLNSWFRDSFISGKITDKKITDLYKNRIAKIGIKHEALKLTIDFPFLSKVITEKDLINNYERYISALQKYSEEISLVKAKARKKLDDYPNFIESINEKSISFNLINKYMIFFFDSDLQVISAKLSEDPVDLSDKCGIVFMYHKCENYNCGFEYSAINGFIFNNGSICSKLVKIVGNHTISGRENYKQPYIISISEGTHLNDSIEEFFYDDLDNVEKEPFFIKRNNNYEIGVELEPICDAVFLDEDIFVHVTDISLDKVENNMVSFIESDFDFLEFNLERNFDIYSDHLEQWHKISSSDSVYCQDGIVIPDKVADLFPVGYFKIICNTTADARKVLNVTRHETSCLYDDVNSWMRYAGTKIQRSLILNVSKMLDSLNLDYSFYSIEKRRKSNKLLDTLYDKNFYFIL